MDEHSQPIEDKTNKFVHSPLPFLQFITNNCHGMGELFSRESNQERYHKVWAWKLGNWESILKRTNPDSYIFWPEIPTALFPDEIAQLKKVGILVIKIKEDEKDVLWHYEAFFLHDYQLSDPFLYRVCVHSYPNVKEPGSK
jgi:hypothetical protein